MHISANIPIHLIQSPLKAIFYACDGNQFSLKTVIAGGQKMSTRFRNQYKCFIELNQKSHYLPVVFLLWSRCRQRWNRNWRRL